MSENPLPRKGELYRHPRLRDRWRVQSCGEKFITLKPTNPVLSSKRMTVQEFMADQGWTRA